MRTSLITAAIVTLFMLMGASGAQPVNPKVAEADDACASFAGVLVAHAEKDARDLVAAWKLKCEHHPVQSTCESTAKFLAQNSYSHALNCANGPRSAEPSRIDPKVAAADDACGSVAGIYEAHAENEDRRQVAQWKVICAHHPLRDRCESTVKFIEEKRHLRVIDCAGSK